jgi:heat shock protein HtpX
VLPAVGLRTHIWNNAIRSVLLIVAFPLVLPAVLFLFVLILLSSGGNLHAVKVASDTALVALLLMILVGLIWFPIAWFGGQAIVDGLTGARRIGRADDPRTWDLLENLCIACGMPMPSLREINSAELNAYASGTTVGTVSVTVTAGLREALNDDELQAVLAHELTHIRNHDVKLLCVAAIFVGLVPMVRDISVRVFWAVVNGFSSLYRFIFTHLLPNAGAALMVRIGYGLFFLLGKLFAVVVSGIAVVFSLLAKAALSRRREFMADGGAVVLTKDPNALISALRKVEGNSDLSVSVASLRDMFFDNPHLSGMEGLFATHPTIKARIDAIQRYAVQPSAR